MKQYHKNFLDVNIFMDTRACSYHNISPGMINDSLLMHCRRALVPEMKTSDPKSKRRLKRPKRLKSVENSMSFMNIKYTQSYRSSSRNVPKLSIFLRKPSILQRLIKYIKLTKILDIFHYYFVYKNQ